MAILNKGSDEMVSGGLKGWKNKKTNRTRQFAKEKTISDKAKGQKRSRNDCYLLFNSLFAKSMHLNWKIRLFHSQEAGISV